MMNRLVLVLVGVSAVVPDIAPDPVPRAAETLAPRKGTAVEMSAETVHLWLEEDSARVEATFTLLNTSPDKEELEVGFPTAAQPKNFTWNSREGMNVTEWGPSSIRDFSATVDGQDVTALPKQGREKDSYKGWLCWPMAFDGSQKRAVVVRYTVPTRDDHYSEPSYLLNRQVTYVLKTGGGWKGNIGEAVILLHLEGMSEENIVGAAPEPADKAKSCWTWRMKDFKPKADILLQYHVYASSKEAVEKLAAKLKKNGSEVETWIDYADNLVAAEEPLRAAEAFARIHELEKQEGRALFRARTEYQSPAYRAAKCYREAGKPVEAREWAQKAVARLQEVARKEPEFSIRKFLRTSPEAIGQRVKECKAWAEE
ncbi:MAG TPA: DUF4424 family protein [Planctomycetota bacterium]|nr:DUF4424 family protein [Planctomycetota bacterium]